MLVWAMKISFQSFFVRPRYVLSVLQLTVRGSHTVGGGRQRYYQSDHIGNAV